MSDFVGRPLRDVLLLGVLLMVATARSAAPLAQEPQPGVALSTSQPSTTLSESLDVTVANLEVFVTDRAGDPVSGLQREDFTLRVEGAPAPIVNFYAEAGVGATPRPTAAPEPGRRDPRVLAPTEPPTVPFVHVLLFVDQDHISEPNRARVFTAVRERVLAELDSRHAIAVVSFDDRLVFHSDFLRDRAAVSKILDQLERGAGRVSIHDVERRRILDEMTRGRSGGRLGRIASAQAEPQANLARIRAYAADAHAQTLRSLRGLETVLGALGGVPGRKAVIHVSEGLVNRPGEDLFATWVNVFGEGNPQASRDVARFDFNTSYDSEVGRYDVLPSVLALAERANAAEATLYTIDAEADHTTDLRSALVEVSASSEALSLLENNLREPLELAAHETGGLRVQASARLGQDLTRLGRDFESFYSLGFEPVRPPGAPQAVEVSVRVPGLVVRHRQRVVTASGDAAAAATTMAMLLFGSGENALEVRLVAGKPQTRADGSSVLPIRVEVPLERIALVPDGSTVRGQLAMFVTVRDRVGDARPVQKVPFQLSIPASALAELRGRPAHYTLEVVLHEGDREVAVGVRDDVARVIATSRLELPR